MFMIWDLLIIGKNKKRNYCFFFYINGAITRPIPFYSNAVNDSIKFAVVLV